MESSGDKWAAFTFIYSMSCESVSIQINSFSLHTGSKKKKKKRNITRSAKRILNQRALNISVIDKMSRCQEMFYLKELNMVIFHPLEQ